MVIPWVLPLLINSYVGLYQGSIVNKGKENENYYNGLIEI